MKMMKFAFLGIAMLSTILLTAQNDNNRGRRQGGDRIEMLTQQLNLTDDQVAQIQALETDFKTKMKALRDQDFESQEDRKTAFQALRAEQETAFNNILTEEQQAELSALKSERKERFQKRMGERKARMENVDREAMHKELKAYHDENVLPTLLTQRAKLESKISVEDQELITELRGQKAEMTGERGTKGQRGAKRGERKGKKELTEEDKEKRAEVKALLEKYADDIKALHAEIETQQAQWTEDIKAIRAKYIPESEEGREMKKRGKGKKEGKGEKMRKGKREGGMKALHFLLLDPNAPNTSEFQRQSISPSTTLNSIRTYPNPATELTTVEYNIKQAGEIIIELRNNQGKVEQTLLNAYQDLGTYTLDVNTANLRSGTYYITIIDQKGQTTQQLIISN
ncbi:MAG: T9SS type A sorting domain-containing protein [Bacteroidota bacterium]